MRALMITGLAGLVMSGCAALAAPPAQPAAPEDRAKAAQDALAQLPPPVRLGLRVEAARRALPVAPVLVIADSTEAYLSALALWSLEVRFPVLIDDSSPRAAEDIARFARAFRPQQTLVLRARADAPAPGKPLKERGEALLARAWGAGSREELAEKWKSMGFTPPGIVALSPNDPAWAGGLGLALGRGQPMLWLEDAFVPGRDSGTMMDDARLGPLSLKVQDAMEATGHSWRALGDDIDAVTLALNLPSKTHRAGAQATTDAIGRHDVPLPAPGAPHNPQLPNTAGIAGGPRYAWSSQVLGTEAQSAYMAMGALFLQARSAWLFDGYRDGAPFGDYDVGRPADTLIAAGLRVTIDNNPEPSPDQWRARTQRPIDAGLIHVNTAGFPRWFELPPGGIGINRASTGDIPMLLTPAIVHFIHSFSAEDVSDRTTIAARWIEQGAYCYAGAVSEPYLTAFQTPERLFGRLLASSPWGAAPRQDNGGLWKVALFGDPLATVGANVGFAGQPPGSPPAPAPIPGVPGARPAQDLLTEALKAHRFFEAARLLVMLGREPDLLKLIEALLASDPESWTPEVARIALPALHRVGRPELVLRAFLRLEPQDQADTLVLDTLWQSARPELASTRNGMLVEALRERMRPGSIAADASALARCARRRFGGAAGERILADAMALTTDEWEQRQIRAELERLRSVAP